MFAKLTLCFCLLGKLLAFNCTQPLVLSDKTAFSVKIVTNDKGDAVAMWISEQKEGEAVFASTKSSDTAWSAPERISKVEKDIVMPRVLIDSHGNVFASWVLEILDEESLLQVAEKPFGSAWNIPTNIISSDGYTQFEDGHLKAVAAFETVGKWSPDFSTSSKRILSAIKELQKDVQLEYVAETCCSSYTGLSVASNEAGTIFAVWERKTADGEHLLEYAWHRPRMSWTPLEQVPLMLSPRSWKAQAAIDTDENITLVCRSQNGKLISLSRSGGVWSGPVILSERGSPPKLTIDDAGNVFVAWMKKNEKKEILCAVYKSAGQAWQEPIDLSPEEYDCCCYDIKPDHHGNFVACWGQSDDDTVAIHGASFSTKEQKWSAPQPLSPEGVSCWSPMLAFSKGEKGFLGWVTQEHVEVTELMPD